MYITACERCGKKGEMWQICLNLDDMGLRHQAFVIAKIGKGKQSDYWCVAAFHWQCLFGPDTARAITRFINAVKNPLNRRLIQADLELFDGYEARVGSRELAVPCPYISMLYRTSTCIGVDDEYSERCHTESAGMASNGGDNNDGISIIDITDSASPRYCMVSISMLEVGKRAPRGTYRPLSAKEYVKSYHNFEWWYLDKRRRARLHAAYEDLGNTPLIDMATLAETWPGEYGESRRQNRWNVGDYAPDDDDSDPETNMVDGANTIDEGPGDEEKKEKIPSLATMAIFKVVHAILQDEDNADQIDLLLRVPMGHESVDAVTASLSARPQLPDYILPVLAKVLIPLPIDGYMDLSQFALSGNQICQVAKLIPSCKILKLGGRLDAEIDDIVNTIKFLPELHTVMLFDDLVSVEQLAHLRQKLPSDRIRIAHRKEYFNAAEYIKLDGPQYTRPNVPDFVFIVDERKKWSRDDEAPIRGVGVEVLDDPNFIIQTVRDFLRVEYRFDAAAIGFTMNKRDYGVPFASSDFVSIASQKAKLGRGCPDRVQWGFVCSPPGYYLVLEYGFFRYQHGSPLQVMDVDGFVTALSKERPDLPPVTLGSAQPGIQFTSFFDDVRYFLGAKPGDETKDDIPNRYPSMLLPVEQVREIILGL